MFEELERLRAPHVSLKDEFEATERLRKEIDSYVAQFA